MTTPHTTSSPIDILVLGGGFAGLNTAFQLSNYPWTRPVRITLVDRNDRFLFTPMAYEILTGEVEVWEIAPLYRDVLGNRAVTFVQGNIERIDLAKRQVQVGERVYRYDYLALALGGRPNFRQVPGADKYSQPFYDLGHVQAYQKHIDRVLDRAKQTSDAKARKALLNFLVVGAGTCGVEVSCKLADYLDAQAQARGLERKEMEIHLIDRNERILRGVAHRLEPIALDALQRRNVSLVLDWGVTKVTPEGVEIRCDKQGTLKQVAAATVTWTGGIEMHPLLADLPIEKDPHGRVRVTQRLEVPGQPGVYAMGDATHFPTDDGKGLPATAQVAVRQSEIAAWNIRADIEGWAKLPYIYIGLGEMLTLGIGEAGADAFGMCIGGTLGAAMRRTVYLTKLPTMGLKVRVGGTWTNEIAKSLLATGERALDAVRQTAAQAQANRAA
ncbi:MAG: NAD(P)/FAD-dependent oxidoreductase [Chloracidobacterium sp.]|uniref:NAD(P)/FAD-dependent oxidoreductase n=1 Tax=Chloracidobacterium validum TaxID=2821543 RepID=A0ABX8BBN1_9BACT|nr:NAD(P)/FAD-dependent oxidoreductase [Chloracidobacterium validum]QUW04347.1 NAD(P)/FAD-dependent oxidoreductase [Chloracidobacterium validum]